MHVSETWTKVFQTVRLLHSCMFAVLFTALVGTLRCFLAPLLTVFHKISFFKNTHTHTHF